MGVPQAGDYVEIFNSDAAKYGGSGVTNQGPLQADGHIPYHGQVASLELTLPPLGAVILKPAPQRN
jgi:1,4-alpha-glucan branching enzyme